MAIAILKLEPGQKIPRPFNRATDLAEAAWVLAYTATYRACTDLGYGIGPAQRKAKAAADVAYGKDPAATLVVKNLDTDEPIFSDGAVNYYGFTEFVS